MRFVERFRFSPWQVAVAVAAAIGLAVGASVVTYRYATNPTRVAEAFLKQCRAGNFGELHGMLDRTYQEVFTPAASRDVLAALNPYVPRDGRVVLAGYPDTYGLVSDWRRYHVRVEPTDAEAARKMGAGFIIILVQGKDGGWRVAFQPTYANLFSDLPGGGEYLSRVLRDRAGARFERLAQWREAAR